MVTKRKYKEMKDFFDEIQEGVNALNNLGCEVGEDANKDNIEDTHEEKSEGDELIGKEVYKKLKAQKEDIWKEWKERSL